MVTDRLSLESLNYDIINSIVPFIDFRDYHNLLLVSRQLQRNLVFTKYGELYRRFGYWERNGMANMMANYRQYPPKSLPMGAVFDALMKSTCECGRHAWYVYCFSGPPRRLCFWTVMGQQQHQNACFPATAVLSSRLREIYNLDEKALQALPTFSPRARPDPLKLVDLNAVEDLARRKLSEIDVKAATAKLLEDPTSVCRDHRWNELTFNRPTPMGFFPSTADNIPEALENYSASMSPLECLICKSHNLSSSPNIAAVYEYVAHDYYYLGDHIKRHHPGMFADYERGWLAFPEKAKTTWSAEGKLVGGTYAYSPCYQLRFPTWDGWANALLAQWSHRIVNLQRHLGHEKENWKRSLGRIRAYSLPDIRRPRGLMGQEEGDMARILDAYFLMKECAAFEELTMRWGNELRKEELIREVANFWEYEEVYHGPTVDPSQAMTRYG